MHYLGYKRSYFVCQIKIILLHETIAIMKWVVVVEDNRGDANLITLTCYDQQSDRLRYVQASRIR